MLGGTVMFWSGVDIGVDLGTSSVLVYVADKGIVVNETSVVAVEKDANKVVAIGDDAREMIGRNPSNYKIVRPLKDGVIADYEVTLVMLKYLIGKVCGKRPLFKPRVAVCIPAKITTVERRAVIEATLEAGARQTYLVEEPMAAAIGSGLDVSEPIGNMIVDIGGGTTDVAVISLGGMVLSQSIKVGGDNCDDAIIRYVRKKYNLMIGERTAQNVKVSIGEAYVENREFENKSMEVRGRDLLTGLPKTEIVTSEDIAKALMEPVDLMIGCAREVLENTPPELAVDVSQNGIIMTGGGSLLKGLDRLLMEVTGIPVHVAEDPVTCVVRGTGKMLETLNKLKPSSVITNVPRRS